MLRQIVNHQGKFHLKRALSNTTALHKPIRQAPSDSSTIQFIDTITSPYTVTTYSRPNIVFTHGKGVHLYDLENNEYIDFSAGIAVTALGHSNPEIAELITKQASTLLHCSNLFYNLHAGELAHALVTKTRSSGGMHNAQRVFLCNSGTEANEAALKFARKHGKSFNDEKIEIICFENAFHGRSMGALSVTPNSKYQAPFAPLIPGVKVAQTGNIQSVKNLLSKDKTCAVIIEPIQGEGGIQVIDEKFLIQLKALCEENDVVLIYDEIQCGLGRTGKLWAHSYLPKEAHPDIVTVAKALGNGFPIGATMITDKVEQVLKVGDHGTTYGGNPLASKIGCYVVDQVSNEEFLNAVNQKSEKFVKGLTKIANKHKQVTQVLGKGLMLGLQFDKSINVADVANKARENGLIVITAGLNVLRIVPALNIDDDAIETGLDILSNTIEDILKDLPKVVQPRDN